MKNNKKLEQYAAIDSSFNRVVGKLLRSPVLETPAQIRIFGFKCIILGICLFPITYLGFKLGDWLGVRDSKGNPLGYVIFIVVILSPYTFFAGLDCLITGRIWTNDKPVESSAISIMAGVAFLVAALASLGYYTYYQRVYLPSIAGEEQLNARFEKEMQNCKFTDKTIGDNPSKKIIPSGKSTYVGKKDPFWDMVESDKRARKRSMQSAPWICGTLWGIALLLYLAYFVSLIPHAK